MPSNQAYTDYLAQSKAPMLNALYAAPIPLEVLSTGLRLWVKVFTLSDGRLYPDDIIITLATIVAVGECIVGLLLGAPHGLGRHIEAVTPDDMAMFLKGDYIFSHFYDVAIATTKLAILALYHRIFAITMFRRLTIWTAAVVLVWLLGMEVTLGFGCRPIKAWWGAAEGACVNKVAFTYATNIVNIVLDVWIFLMPIPTIFKLRTGQHKKISLAFLFSVGLGTCAISAVRLKYVFSAGTRDFTWEMTGLGILSAWEPCGGILCANLPVVYRYIVQVASQLKASIAQCSAQGEVKTHSSVSPSQRLMQHDWVQLPAENMGLSTVVVHNRHPVQTPGRTEPCELGSLPWSGIKVQQSIHQQREW
ncbi:uncharacterized protein B0I36DRAFT_423020 [Microdochium trichocladiopsis]|uniref:Rhodopsin domain-containing protein n=1 Tax=Microdochium trichocladiopsis TaxID=1682393 RepID=A0A9P9BPL5_9PEZI|nr:uncharacterized protein B0I36DRAFT_423020 [Microdochium trichocladiopsis]KAH7029352.1 hypothetical protein B0I36DRAFT_423020 [Microdochium trichocladiopsis]